MWIQQPKIPSLSRPRNKPPLTHLLPNNQRQFNLQWTSKLYPRSSNKPNKISPQNKTNLAVYLTWIRSNRSNPKTCKKSPKRKRLEIRALTRQICSIRTKMTRLITFGTTKVSQWCSLQPRHNPINNSALCRARDKVKVKVKVKATKPRHPSLCTSPTWCLRNLLWTNSKCNLDSRWGIITSSNKLDSPCNLSRTRCSKIWTWTNSSKCRHSSRISTSKTSKVSFRSLTKMLAISALWGDLG